MNIITKTLELNNDIKITLTAKRGYKTINENCINEKEVWADENEITVNAKGVDYSAYYKKINGNSPFEKDNEMFKNGCLGALQCSNKLIIGLSVNSNTKVEAFINEVNAIADTPEVIAKRKEIEEFKEKNLQFAYEYDKAMKNAEWMATLGGKSY